MRDFWVLWTYIANYSGLIRVSATSEEDAAEFMRRRYGDEFKQKATIYVFDKKPAVFGREQ